MILAQTYIASPPIEIAAWLACLAFVIGVINGGYKLARNFKDKPAAGEVQRESAEKFARREQLESHMRDTHENFTIIRAELAEDRRQVQIQASEHSTILFAEIRAVRTEVLAKMDSVRVELSTKTDDMPSKIIADLRNAKGLIE